MNLFTGRFHISQQIKTDFTYFGNLPSLVRADEKPDRKLNGEEDDNKVVEKLDDENHPRKVNISRLILQTF